MIAFISSSETSTITQVRKALEIESGDVTQFSSVKNLISKCGQTIEGVLIIHYSTKQSLIQDSEFLLKLKKLKFTKNIHMIFILDFESQKSNEIVYKVGFDDILPKHVLPKTLKLKIHKAVSIVRYRKNKKETSKSEDFLQIKAGESKNLYKFGQNTSALIKNKTFVNTDEDKKQSVFIPIHSSEEKTNTIQEADERKAKGFLWTNGQKFKTPIQIKSALPQKIIMDYPEGHDQKSFLKEFEKAKSKPFYVNFNLPQCSVFFQQNFEEVYFGKNSFVLSIPENIWRVQRRAYERLELNNKIIKKAECIWKYKRSGEILRSKVFIKDISAGGCSLIFSDNDENYDLIAQKDRIEFVEFMIETKKIKSKAEVRWMKSLKISGEMKKSIGIQFLDLPEESWRTIFLFVLEHLFKKK